MYKEVSKIKKELSAINGHINSINTLLKSLDKRLSPNFEDVPGVLGTFDGFNMVAESGEKYEVNPNYAAKSQIIFGTKLKMIEDEEGKLFFKQIEKPEITEVEGVLSKKADEWHVLTSGGSYKVSPIAVEFYQAQPNDEAVVLLPKGNAKAPFAAIKRLIKNGKDTQTQPKAKAIKKPAAKPKATAKKAAPKTTKKEAVLEGADLR